MKILIILYYYFILAFIFKTALFSALYYERVDLCQIPPSPKGRNVLGKQTEQAVPPCFPRKTLQKRERETKPLQAVSHKEGRKDPYQTEDDSSGVRPPIYWVSKTTVPSGLDIRPTVGVRRTNPIFSSGISSRHKTSSFKSSKTAPQPHESHKGLQKQHLTQSLEQEYCPSKTRTCSI